MNKLTTICYSSIKYNVGLRRHRKDREISCSKVLLALAVVALLPWLRFPQATSYAQPSRQSSPADEISVTLDSISIGTTVLNLPLPKEKLIRLLGEPTRTIPRQNIMITYVWDNLGLTALEKPKYDKIVELRIAVTSRDEWKKPFDSLPANKYSGTLTVDGAVVTSDKFLSEINGAKKGKPFVQCTHPPCVWMIRYKNCTVAITHLNLDEGDKLGFLSITAD